MNVTQSQMQCLRKRAKEEFDIASAMGAKAEGVAILMRSGLIVAGYTQPAINGNAAADALRCVTPNIPSGKKPDSKAMDHFTIACAIIVTDAKNGNPVRATLNTLKDYLFVTGGAQIYIAKPIVSPHQLKSSEISILKSLNFNA